MKRILFILLSLLIIGNHLYAQQSYKNEVTWLGLDFTHAQFANKSAFTNSRVIRDSYLLKWNNIIFNEPGKYDIAKFLEIENLKSDISYINERNLTIPHQDLVVDMVDNSFNQNKVENCISEYPKSEGIGLVIIVESFDKMSTTGTFWVCFLDRTTKELLETTKIKGKASGVGIKNYWANSLYRAMKKYKKI